MDVEAPADFGRSLQLNVVRLYLAYHFWGQIATIYLKYVTEWEPHLCSSCLEEPGWEPDIHEWVDEPDNYFGVPEDLPGSLLYRRRHGVGHQGEQLGEEGRIHLGIPSWGGGPRHQRIQAWHGAGRPRDRFYLSWHLTWADVRSDKSRPTGRRASRNTRTHESRGLPRRNMER